jgi:hypothetical protein
VFCRASCAAKSPCASRRGGVAQTVHPCTASQSRRSIAATLAGIFPPRLRCSALRTAPLIHESVHPCTTPTNRLSDSWLLRQDAAEMGPPEARRGCVGKVRRRAHTMCARSLNVHGRTSSEPRSALAQSQGRMPGDRAAGGVFLWLSFFAQAKKVTRSPAGRVEALHFKG